MHSNAHQSFHILNWLSFQDLKQKYNELNAEYQRLPFMIDTPSMKTRKVRLEVEMKQLEDDIKLLNRLESICKTK